MESNKDEALRALSIAQRHRDAGNYESARRFANKSLALFATPEAKQLLGVIDAEEASDAASSSSSPSASTFTSSAETHPSSSGVHQRHTKSTSHANGDAKKEEKRDYTPENAAVVKRVRACKATQYYEIMNVKKDCEEADVKKAYRKVCTLSSCCVILLLTLVTACPAITPRQERGAWC